MRPIFLAAVLALLGHLLLGLLAVLSHDFPTEGIKVTRGEYGKSWPFAVSSGRLRCEGAGAVVFTAGGQDYALNGMAADRYASIDSVWKAGEDPDVDAGPIIARGLTLCEW
jgi:hypothetical protein